LPVPPAGRTMDDATLIAEKVAAAREAVAESEADCWLTFARETTEIAEPCLPFLLGFDVVWPTAVVVTPERSVTILGRHDAPNAEQLGVHDVRPYDESIAEDLVGTIEEIDPDRIALNVSEDDTVADGLTHGMYRRLQEVLDGTGYEESFVSAEPIVARVRGRKSAAEYERIVTAAEETERLLAAAVDAWTPETTEAEFSEFLHERMREADYGSAWSWDYCPTVHAGGAAPVGHTLPGDRTVPPGEVLHVDFGVTVDGYAADMQRLYYRPQEAGESIPADLQAAYEDVRAAIDAGAAALGPGAVGHEVDSAARAELTDRGWPAFQHAFGHQVGRNAHDGGTLLGPQWDRYGGLPDREVAVDEVYTMELGVETEWGYLGQEEMVRITEDGHEFVVDPQTEFRRLAP
jgi:Xaa-Pro aminopeptidase